MARASPSIPAPVPPHLDAAFAIPCDKNPVILIRGHGTHNHVPLVYSVHRELAQQASAPVDGPGIDVTVHAAAQQRRRVRQAGPGL